MIHPRTRRALPFVLLAAAVASTVLCVLLPRQHAIGRLREELQQCQQCLRDAQHVQATISNVEKELKATQDYVRRCAGRTGSEAELVSLFGEIADAASLSGVVTQRFQPEKADDGPAPVKRLTAAVEAQGDFPAVFDFLGRLERLPVALWIENLHLSQAEDEPGRLSCEMKLVIFADNRDISD